MKHAYLIMAHDNWKLLNRLVNRLDDERNEIFIHIDLKSKILDTEIMEIKNSCKFSKIRFVPRHKISWGGYSIINCELRLLEEAVKSDVSYCHILSGNDYLCKSINDIDDFFCLHSGKEFVEIANEEFLNKEQFRYKLYHPLQEIIGRNWKKMWYLHIVEKLLLLLQSCLGMDRTKAYSDLQFYGGSQWCSITKEFAMYLIKREEDIEKIFKYSYCCDEVFIQTILYDSPFRERRFVEKSIKDYRECLRCIDWERGAPYTFTEEDFEMLVNSGYFFCRKVNNDNESHLKLLEKLDNL